MEQGTEIRGIVRAVCISPEKGTEKRPVPEAFFKKDFGVEGDAHAGKWHRQVSLLSYDKVEAFNARGAQVEDGDFGENLLVEGIDFKNLPVGSILRCGTVVMRMTQIGKECHTSCAIRMRVGDCIMPREGVFAEVLEEGTIRPGDVLTAQLPNPERPFTVAVITLSDKGAKGDRVDQSGPAAVQMLDRPSSGWQTSARQTSFLPAGGLVFPCATRRRRQLWKSRTGTLPALRNTSACGPRKSQTAPCSAAEFP